MSPRRAARSAAWDRHRPIGQRRRPVHGSNRCSAPWKSSLVLAMRRSAGAGTPIGWRRFTRSFPTIPISPRSTRSPCSGPCRAA